MTEEKQCDRCGEPDDGSLSGCEDCSDDSFWFAMGRGCAYCSGAVDGVCPKCKTDWGKAWAYFHEGKGAKS